MIRREFLNNITATGLSLLLPNIDTKSDKCKKVKWSEIIISPSTFYQCFSRKQEYINCIQKQNIAAAFYTLTTSDKYKRRVFRKLYQKNQHHLADLLLCIVKLERTIDTAKNYEKAEELIWKYYNNEDAEIDIIQIENYVIGKKFKYNDKKMIYHKGKTNIKYNNGIYEGTVECASAILDGSDLIGIKIIS